MGVESFFQYMRDLYGKMNANVHNQGTGLMNSQQLAFMRQLQKDVKVELASQLTLENMETVVFDIETTGFFPDKGDQIISIGAVKVRGCVITDEEFYTLVQHNGPISEEISALTGIYKEDTEQAPLLSEALIDFFEFAKNDTLVAHHSSHEKNFMQSACWKQFKTPFKHRIVDTAFLFKIVDPQKSIVSLEDWCSLNDIPAENRHHALGDARLTALLWTRYLKKAQELGCVTLQDIYERLARR
ncbi:exonuclease domain-containing protein [Bacillales bacterium AN1005]|uniref:exonuclease domain-containing protein n=1 Tax=Niallia taxi TaxID=2499688 RepID=UPI0021A5A842|nr:exonuclease domain-containing protein [Niallia taxi]MCT2346415.1 exonuclease domain-containing protein [Niallia taxi]